MFFYIFCYLAIGDRGGFLYFVVIPLIAYHYLYKKIEIKRIMTEYEVNSSEAETMYYDKYPNEKPNDYESR